jgi:predicted transcriptional regulator
MTKVTKIEIVRDYAKKNPNMTVREMASELDMTPAGVHQIMWSLRKKGEVPPSKRSRKTNKIEVPKEWEEDAQQMAKEVKGFAQAPIKTEGTAIAYDNTQDVNVLKIAKLEIELARAQIIISYLEQRIHEEINGKGRGY